MISQINSWIFYSVNKICLPVLMFTSQLAQPIRLLLNYVGEEFEDVKYEQGDRK